MKRIYLFLLFVLMSLSASSQMYVKEGSFKYIPNAVMDDKEDHTDGNDLPMALIKISTENIPEQERLRFVFSGNRATQVVKVNKTGQVWIYITAESADFIDMKHPDYGTHKYYLPERLRNFGIYEMVLVSNFNANDNSKPTVNYLSIKTEHSDAMIFIDDEFVGLKEVSKLLGVGKTYKWRVECDMYHAESGETILSYGEPVVKNVKLRPAFGYVNVNTLPESGAMIYIDNKYVGKTPLVSGKLKIGNHKMVVVKDMYKPSNHEFMITDNDTTYLNLNMTSNVVKVDVVTDSLSYIYIDNEMKDMGRWSGKISLGTHLFEARKSCHKTTYLDVDIKQDKNEIIVISDPEPVYGSLSVDTDPDGANIYIDDEYQGLTPRVIENVLIGEHEIKLKKEGYAFYSRKINVMEDETFILNENLFKGKNIKIETDSEGDRIYVDRQYVGNSPTMLSMSYGFHTIMVERDGYTTEEDFNVTENGKSEVKLFFGKEIQIETDHVGDNVFVDGLEVGSSPCVVRLSFGTHNLTVRRGNIRLDRTIVVDKKASDNKLFVALGKNVMIKTTENGDDVYVDNVRVGKTPLKRYLSFGNHTVKVEKAGKSVTKDIVVKESGGQDVFTLYYGQLVKFESSKSGDAVFVDGKRMGNTPLELDLTLGSHKVKVKRHRKVDVKNLNITKNGNSDYYFYPIKETLSEFIDNGVRYISLNASERLGQKSYGISFGGFRKVGWYLSVMTNFDVADTLICTGVSQFLPAFKYDMYYGYDDVQLTENVMHSRLSLVGGMMFKIGGPVYLKIGAGYGLYSEYVQDVNGKWYVSETDLFQDLLLTSGLQFNIKRLVLSADVVTSEDFKTWEFKVGLGFAWRKK